jgi:hypothetical protein
MLQKAAKDEVLVTRLYSCGFRPTEYVLLYSKKGNETATRLGKEYRFCIPYPKLQMFIK